MGAILVISLRECGVRACEWVELHVSHAECVRLESPVLDIERNASDSGLFFALIV